MRLVGAIDLPERDYFLDLDEPDWPTESLPIIGEDREQWADDDGEVGRTQHKGRSPWYCTPWGIGTHGKARFLSRELKRAAEPSAHLFESVIRFPSAPLFGIQRKRDYQYRLEPLHQHTFRFLSRKKPGTVQISRIFIFLNGLNEIDFFDFYYDLAEMLTKDDSAGVQSGCVIYPYPGHLTRYPMWGKFAEKPLQRFITDPGDLFRQYLRFMIEMRWLLSILVPVSYYPVAAGMPLLAEVGEDDRLGGRCNPEFLSGVLQEDWDRVYKRSLAIINESEESKALKELRSRGRAVTVADFLHAIHSVREVIGWRPSETTLIQGPRCGPTPPPRIHVVGYSLGGYLAQSAFFSWPFAICSCTSLCSGAALHTLRPQKMAHVEEWHAITHGLKYEIESGMLERRIRLEREDAPEHQSVCGISATSFASYFRIFTDVFLQDHHGSYRHRVSEFAHRLLFVVGGNDPIVSTQSVLDASPPGGINLIEIANLSHFIAVDGGEWPSFWLPIVAGVVSSLAEHGEGLMAMSVLSSLLNSDGTGPALGPWPSELPNRATVHFHPGQLDTEPLDSEGLRTVLSQAVGSLREGAFLFVLRNQIPFALMGKRLLQRRGGTPHYEDIKIRRFWQELQDWLKEMLEAKDRITLVVPGRLNEWFVKPPSVLSEKSMPLARETPPGEYLAAIWAEFLNDWESTGALFRFNPEIQYVESESKFQLERHVRFDSRTPRDHPVLNCLPDLWLVLSPAAVGHIAGSNAGRQGIHDGFMSHVREAYMQLSGHDNARTNALEKAREQIAKKEIQIIRVSAAQANPRYLGERIWNSRTGIDHLVHCALALARSTACAEPGSFKSGWDMADRSTARK